MSFDPSQSEVAWHLDFETQAAPGKAAPSSPPDLLGELFEIQGVLGSGGMGVVYRALHRRSQRPVALKLVRATSGTRAKFRLEAEGRATGRVKHPGIVQVLGAGVAGEEAYLALELVDGGQTLDKVLQVAPLSERVQLVAQVADALGAVHAAGIVHRDIKGENVIVDRGGRARLLDFGIALAEEEERLTVTGEIVGTPYYMAPERFEFRDSGPAADVWSLGVLLYQALTGSLPYRADNLLGLLGALEGPLEPPSSAADGVPPEVEAVCLRCLTREPADRYANGAEVAEALRAASPVAARRAAPWLALAVVLALCSALGAAVAFVNRGPEVGALRAEAEALHSAERYEEALVVLDRWVRLEPEDATAHALRGEVNLELERLVAAKTDYDRALEHDPESLAAYTGRGAVLMQSGAFLEAAEDYTAALALTPGDANLHMKRGFAYLEADQPLRALAEGDLAVERDPLMRRAHYLRGMALVRVQRHEEALAALNRTLELKRSALVLIARAEIYEQVGQLRAALDDYTVGLELRPASSHAYTRRGGVLLGLQDPVSAHRDFDAALRIDPGAELARLGRAKAAHLLGKLEDAIADYTAFAEQAPHPEPTVYLSRALAYASLGRHAEVIADTHRAEEAGLEGSALAKAQDLRREALRLQAGGSDGRADELIRLGIEKLGQGRFEDARDDFDAALRLVPSWGEAHIQRGLCNEALGDEDQAAEDYTRAIGAGGNSPRPYFLRGGLYLGQGKLQAGIRDFNQALALKPDFAEAYYRRGLSKAQLGAFGEAEADFTRAIELGGGETGVAHLMRASCRELQGDYAGALAGATEALERGLSGEDARLAKEIRARAEEALRR